MAYEAVGALNLDMDGSEEEEEGWEEDEGDASEVTLPPLMSLLTLFEFYSTYC
jgi:hypothetical protein